MKKITIIFGGMVEFYRGYFGVFRKIDDEFKISIRRNSPYRFSGKVGDINLDFRFCFQPIKDNNYKENKKYQETSPWKELVPEPASELVKKIKSDAVIFAGMCGAFKGKKNAVFTPEKFSEILFSRPYIAKDDNVKPMNTFSKKNLLTGLGKSSHAVTSNATLNPSCMEGRSPNLLIKIGEELSKKGDHVDKEVYQIAKGVKKDVLFGAFVMASDVITIKKHMLDEKAFTPNKNVFNRNLIKAIKIMMEKIK